MGQRDGSHGRRWSDLGTVRSLLWLECAWDERGCKTSLEKKGADKFQRELYAKPRSLMFSLYRQTQAPTECLQVRH